MLSQTLDCNANKNVFQVQGMSRRCTFGHVCLAKTQVVDIILAAGYALWGRVCVMVICGHCHACSTVQTASH